MAAADPTPDIPYGYCHCGCGQQTNINSDTDPRRGDIKGQPRRFVNGHQNRTPGLLPLIQQRNGLCACGCGQPTPIAKMTHLKRGNIKGQPQKYIRGHVRHQRQPGSKTPVKIGLKCVHQLRAAKALGKPLPPQAVVHHPDEDPWNPDARLIICENQVYHMLLHRRAKAYRVCGHADWLRCIHCKQYDDPVNLKVWISLGVTQAVHRACRTMERRRRTERERQRKGTS